MSAFLHEPSLARFITIDPDDTVNPDQDIKPMFKYVISMSWRGQRKNFYAFRRSCNVWDARMRSVIPMTTTASLLLQLVSDSEIGRFDLAG